MTREPRRQVGERHRQLVRVALGELPLCKLHDILPCSLNSTAFEAPCDPVDLLESGFVCYECVGAGCLAAMAMSLTALARPILIEQLADACPNLSHGIGRVRLSRLIARGLDYFGVCRNLELNEACNEMARQSPVPFDILGQEDSCPNTALVAVVKRGGEYRYQTRVVSLIDLDRAFD